jgi:hypothetical protein
MKTCTQLCQAQQSGHLPHDAALAAQDVPAAQTRLAGVLIHSSAAVNTIWLALCAAAPSRQQQAVGCAKRGMHLAKIFPTPDTPPVCCKAHACMAGVPSDNSSSRAHFAACSVEHNTQLSRHVYASPCPVSAPTENMPACRSLQMHPVKRLGGAHSAHTQSRGDPLQSMRAAQAATNASERQ